MENKLGTYTTFDCPTEKISEALAFLKAEFEAIGGNVWKKINDHDFEAYPSFEIDYPEHLEFVDADDDFADDDDNDLAIEKGLWHEKADKIAEKYSEKFKDFL